MAARGPTSGRVGLLVVVLGALAVHVIAVAIASVGVRALPSCPPPVVGIRGIPKSGTTWLELQLIALAKESAKTFQNGASVAGDVREGGLVVKTAATDGNPSCTYRIYMNGPGKQHKHEFDILGSVSCKRTVFEKPPACLKRFEPPLSRTSFLIENATTASISTTASSPGSAASASAPVIEGESMPESSDARRQLRAPRKRKRPGTPTSINSGSGSSMAGHAGAGRRRQRNPQDRASPGGSTMQAPPGTEAARQCLPKCVRLPKYLANELFIIIFRDPRDALISSYYFGNAANTFDNTAAMAEKSLVSRARRVAVRHFYYVESGFAPHVLPMYYEDLRLDQRTQLMRMAKALRLPVNDDILERVMRQTSFEKMRELEDKDKLVGIHRANGGTARKTRCGSVAQWESWPQKTQEKARAVMRQEMTPALQRIFLNPARDEQLHHLSKPEGALCDA